MFDVGHRVVIASGDYHDEKNPMGNFGKLISQYMENGEVHWVVEVPFERNGFRDELFGIPERCLDHID